MNARKSSVARVHPVTEREMLRALADLQAPNPRALLDSLTPQGRELVRTLALQMRETYATAALIKRRWQRSQRAKGAVR